MAMGFGVGVIEMAYVTSQNDFSIEAEGKKSIHCYELKTSLSLNNGQFTSNAKLY